MNTINDFSQLSAESVESAFAQLSPQEHAEYQQWLEQTNASLNALDAQRAQDRIDKERQDTAFKIGFMAIALLVVSVVCFML